jgi:glutaredoxin
MDITLNGNILIKHKKLPDCEFCDKCENLLNEKGISFTTIYSDKWFFGEIMRVTKSQSVPQVILKGQLVGDYSKLEEYFKENNEST